MPGQRFVKGGGYGLIGDLVVGLLGAVILLFVVRQVKGGGLRRT